MAANNKTKSRTGMLGEGNPKASKSFNIQLSNSILEKLEFKVELVSWIDSTTIADNWTEIDSVNLNVSMECWTIGFLLHEDNEKIILVESIGLDKYGERPYSIDFGIAIPKIAIKNRIKIID